MADAQRPLPPKKEVALALLEGGSMFVHLDPRRAGVLVPKWFTGQAQLVLQVGLNMAIPIPDLKVDDEGVTCTLSFSRTPFWCKLPWSAVYALVGEDSRGMIWPDDVPPEVRLDKPQGTTPQKTPQKRAKTKLNAVESQASGGDTPLPRSAGKRARDEAKADIAAKEAKSKVDTASHQRATPADLEQETAVVGRKLRPVISPVPDHDAAASGPKSRSPEPSMPSKPRLLSEAEPSEAASPSERPASAGKKPKRELPPYLRVIK